VISIGLSVPAAILIATGGALWIYRDTTTRGMNTADMWAVGFVVGFFLLPIIGGVLVFAYHLQERRSQSPTPTAATR